MNILFTLNSSNPGGMEYHVLDLVKGLVAREHSVFVISPNGKMTKFYQDAGATVFGKKISFDIDPFYIFYLVGVLRQNKIDCVHSHELKASINSLIAGKIAGVPVRISHTHTPISEWQIGRLKKKVNTFVNSLIVNLFATKEIALTQSRKNVKIQEGIREEKLEAIPNGVQVEKFSLSSEQKNVFRKEILSKNNIPEDAFVFGNVGRLSKEKGHEQLISAFAEFVETLSGKGQDTSSVYLLIAGGGVLEGVLREQTASLGLSDKVIFTGVFPYEDLVKYYCAFDIFVFPSLAEGFGLVLAEAMSSQLLILCSDLEVLQEVGGASVVYFETANVHSLSEKMYDLYMRYDQFDALGVSAKQRVEDLFSMEKFVDRYEQLYISLLSE